jgi:hypothetical protein
VPRISLSTLAKEKEAMRTSNSTIEENVRGSRNREFLRKLNSLDFAPLAYNLMVPEERPGMSLAQAVAAIKAYKGFLFLYHASQGKVISPSRHVDRVWHAHILDTELYTVQTAMLFGHYLHHFPFFGNRDDADRRQLLVAAEFTKAEVLRYFGWDDDHWCGTAPDGDRTLSSEEVRLLKLPIWITICKPLVHLLNKDILVINLKRLPGISRLLVEERLTPEGFSRDLVKLETQAGAAV